MANPSSSNQPIEILTPLGKDALLLAGFSGQEGISQLFNFHLDLLAENGRDIPFEKLLGQKVLVRLALHGGKNRFFGGICSRLCQGERDQFFTTYQMEVVPQFWLLTRRQQSRIFQHATVPDILKAVLKGLDVEFPPLQGKFYPRNYCVQYRETDFNFASRLMEEEGIYYFFKHAADGHKMVVANSPQTHPDVPEQKIVPFETVLAGTREEFRITEWKKFQELCSGRFSLWDHSFELPGKQLEAEKPLTDSVSVGKVAHKLKLPINDPLEIYDYPGSYAHRFDGVDKGGGDRAGDLSKIFEDNNRTVEIRMQAEAARGLTSQGTSNCRQFISGHKFTLQGHFNADGPYLLTTVQHQAKLTGDFQAFRSGTTLAFGYENKFTCIPLALPFRPLLTTPKPVVQGAQTATVVGPPGPEEIFTDKYGRVKVQFHWDRQGQKDAGSSCWIRVASSWAGKGWGGIQLPRIGQEVVVEFLEGDPDRPIIIGNVYNAEQMPAFPLPAGRNISGFKSKTNQGGGYHEITMDDTSGKELVRVHSQKDMDTTVENDKREHVLNDRLRDVTRHQIVDIGGKSDEKIKLDMNLEVGGNSDEHVKLNKCETVKLIFERNVGAWMNEMVVGFRTNVVGGYRHETVIGWKKEEVIMSKTSNIRCKLTQNIGKDYTTTVGKGNCSLMVAKGFRKVEVPENTYSVQAKEIQLQATEKLTLICGGEGGSSITLEPGKIVIKSGDQETITLEKGKEIVIGAHKIQVISSDTDVKLDAANDLNLGGSTFHLVADSDGAIDAGSLEVKGSPVKINC